MQITITNGTLTSIQETLSPDSGYALPSSITVVGATASYNPATGVVTLASPTSTMSITAVAAAAISIGSLPLAKAFLGTSEITKIILGNVTIYEKTRARNRPGIGQ